MAGQPDPALAGPSTSGRLGDAGVLDDLVDALRLFSVETDVLVDHFTRAHGLHRSDMDAVMWVSAGDAAGASLTVGALASRLGLGAPATSALVDRLERAGHVRRQRDPADRRRVTVSMQPSAQRLAMEFFAPLGQVMGRASAAFDEAELATAARVVRAMVAAVVERRTSLDSAQPG